MSAEVRPLSEINHKVLDILIREMGVVDTLRYLNQFSSGSGDYTKDRSQWLDELSLEEVTSAIKASRKQRA